MHDTMSNVCGIARGRFFLDYIMVDLCSCTGYCCVRESCFLFPGQLGIEKKNSRRVGVSGGRLVGVHSFGLIWFRVLYGLQNGVSTAVFLWCAKQYQMLHALTSLHP